MKTENPALDFSTYDQVALEESLLAIDKERHPENHCRLLAEIQRRKDAGKWNSADEAFRSSVLGKRAIWMIALLAYLPAAFFVQIGYRSFTGHDLPVLGYLLFFGLFAVIYVALLAAVAREPCPKCHRAFGLLDANSLIKSGRCPQCGFDPGCNTQQFK